MTDAHSLVIGRFRTRLALGGLAEDGPPLAREVTRSVRELLPPMCARALEPRLGSRSGVVRIDRLRLSLGLGRAGLSAAALADRLARDLAERIAAAVEGGAGPGVAAWPDHASFAAAYLAHRLGLAPSPDWAFPDFRPLAHLSPAEATVELVAARPLILAALARLLAGSGGAGRLAAALPEQAAAQLVARLAAAAQAPDPAAEGPLLSTLLAALPEAPAASPGRAALAAAVALAAEGRDGGAQAPALAALARLAVALAAVAGQILRDRGRPVGPDDLVPAAYVDLPPEIRTLAEAALAPAATGAPARRALIDALDDTSARPTVRLQRRPDAASAPSAEAAEPAASARVIDSRIAGVGLLLPTALRHGLPGQLSPAALHRVLVAALDEADRAAARLDPLPAALAPFDPRDGEPTFPPVPETLRAAVPEAHRAALAEIEGAAGWAGCLLHAFAAGLPGFETSSPGYLRRQFVARPGRLTVAPERMTLVLAPLPLGILLRHAGLHGWSGRLPQAGGALLRIEIEDSR